MKKKNLEKMVAIALKARVLREHQRASSSFSEDCSPREVLALELISGFSAEGVTEKTLSRIFGLSPSSVSDLIRHLTECKLVEKETGEDAITRGRPLKLTAKGETQLKAIKASDAARFAFLLSKFDGYSDEEKRIVNKFLDDVHDAATTAVNERIFDKYVLKD